MKPANFPGRTLARRIFALARLESSYGWRTAQPSASLIERIGAAAAREHKTVEHYVLTARVAIGPARARAIRTKKDRSARAKLSRAA